MKRYRIFYYNTFIGKLLTKMKCPYCNQNSPVYAIQDYDIENDFYKNNGNLRIKGITEGIIQDEFKQNIFDEGICWMDSNIITKENTKISCGNCGIVYPFTLEEIKNKIKFKM